MKCNVFIKGDTIRVIGDDPTRLAGLGEVVSAGRFADVYPTLLDGALVWVVRKDDVVYGPFGTKDQALEFEVKLCRIS